MDLGSHAPIIPSFRINYEEMKECAIAAAHRREEVDEMLSVLTSWIGGTTVLLFYLANSNFASNGKKTPSPKITFREKTLLAGKIEILTI